MAPNSRVLLGLATAVLLLAPVAAFAAEPNPQFDVERATRAYLDLLQGPARARSNAYYEGGYWLILWDAVIAVAVNGLLLFTGLSARFARFAERVTWRWLAPALYAAPYAIATALIALPWTVYEGFWRESQYGLMSQSFGGWLGDQAVMLMLTVMFMPLLLIAVFAVIRGAPRRWWLWGAGVMTLFVATGALLTPMAVSLFYTVSELPGGPLRDRIVILARANGVPADHILVAATSRTTSRISAAVAGIGPTARIGLTDNLLTRTGPDEVIAVLGHEMGHYVLGHVWWTIGLSGMVFLVMFAAVAWAAPRLTRRFPRWRVRDVADPAAVPVLLGLAAIAGMVLTPVQNTIVRTQEVQADRFGVSAAKAPDAFARIAIRLTEYRKLEPGPVEEFLFFDHPSGANRVRMMMWWKKDHVRNARMVLNPSLAPGQ